MLSPLQLENFRLLGLEIIASDGFDPDTGISIKVKSVQIGFGYAELEEPDEAVVNMGVRLSISLSSDNENSPIQTARIGGEAMFSLPTTLPSDVANVSLITNCASILYGVLRGIMLNSTATVLGGPITLPSIEIGALVDEEDEDLQSFLAKVAERLEVQKRAEA